MKIVGLCGGIGSGKSMASAYFSSFNLPVIDADKVYHDLVNYPSECLGDIEREFGNGVVSGGKLDRKALSKIVFEGVGSSERLEKLNSITHHHVLKRIRELLSDLRLNGHRIAVVEVPLLFESGFDRECDVTVAIVADREKRIARICHRDGVDRETAEKRIDSQISDDVLVEKADFYIKNNGSLEHLSNEINKIIKFLYNEV